MKFIRLSVFSTLVAWLVISLWGWFIGGGSSCGAVFRIIGFTTWGFGLCISPLLLIAPTECNKTTQRLGLASPLPFYKLIPLLLHSGLLVFLALDLPCAKSGDGEIIAVAGLLAAIIINSTSLSLAILLHWGYKKLSPTRKR